MTTEFKFDRSKRLMARLERAVAMNESGPEVGAALFAIGTLVSNNAKRRLARLGAVDTGFLRASVAHRIEQSRGLATVVIGPFGVKYARMVEYGGVMTRRQMRAMFATMHRMGRKQASKGIIKGGRYRGRPYMGPALNDSRSQIEQIIRNLVMGS